MSALDQVKAGFHRHTGEGRSFIDVPEWGEEVEEVVDGQPVKRIKPLRIWWRPFTGAEQRRARRDKDGGEINFAKLIVLKAQDEKGNRLFGGDDELTAIHTLEVEADWVVVTRVALSMIVSPKIKDLEKN